MPCCCTNTLNLGCIVVCDGQFIDTGIKAQKDGVYELQVDFLGTSYSIRVTLAIDDDLKFPTTGLSENYEYKGKVVDPDSDTVLIDTYDCIQFQTKLQFDLNTLET